MILFMDKLLWPNKSSTVLGSIGPQYSVYNLKGHWRGEMAASLGQGIWTAVLPWAAACKERTPKLTHMLLFLDLSPLISQGLKGGGINLFPCCLLVLLLLPSNVLPSLPYLDQHSLAQCFLSCMWGIYQELTDFEHSLVVRAIYIVSLSGRSGGIETLCWHLSLNSIVSKAWFVGPYIATWLSESPKHFPSPLIIPRQSWLSLP